MNGMVKLFATDLRHLTEIAHAHIRGCQLSKTQRPLDISIIVSLSAQIICDKIADNQQTLHYLRYIQTQRPSQLHCIDDLINAIVARKSAIDC